MHSVQLCGLAVVLPLVIAGCAAKVHDQGYARGVTNMQPAPPTMQDEGWAILVEADREMKDLTAIRAGASEPYLRDNAEMEMAVLRASSDRLVDDMTVGDGLVHDRAIEADIANLNRVMHAGAATERQAESQPQATPSR